MRTLLEAGADVNVQGPGGATALHAAYAHRDVEKRQAIAAELFRAVSDEDQLIKLLSTPDDVGRSAFVVLAAHNITANSALAFEANFALRAGSNNLKKLVNTPDKDNISPYKAAVLAENTLLIRQFVEAGILPSEDLTEPSLQDVARSRKLWKALAALPVDRNFDVELKKGAKKTDLETIQQQLKNWGYYTGEIDGNFGPGSRASMIKFMKDRELELIGMGGSPYYTKTEHPNAGAGDVTLSINNPSRSDGCRWRVVHWRPSQKNNEATKFVGCVRPTSAHWNAEGFGYVEFGSGDGRIMLFGPNGWDDASHL